MTIDRDFQAKHRGGASEFLPNTPFKLPILFLETEDGMLDIIQHKEKGGRALS